MDSIDIPDSQPKFYKNKKEEADKQYKKGQKAITTSLLKWSKDHLGASLYFETAGKLYKEIGDIVKAKDSFLKYAESSEATGLLSGAADGYT
jgi:hypothetical protein